MAGAAAFPAVLAASATPARRKPSQVAVQNATPKVNEKSALSSGRTILFKDNFAPGNYDDADIVAFSLDNGKRTIVQRGGFYGRYFGGGYFAWVRNNTLFGARFDLDRLALTGDGVPLLEDVRNYDTDT